MNPKEIEFRLFDAGALAATSAEWGERAANLAFPHDVERLFGWVASHLEHKDGEEVAYGLFRGGSNVAEGICEVVVARSGTVSAWVKHLRLWLNPDLDERLEQDESEAVEEAIAVFSHSLIGVLALKMAHKAVCLKVYGRNKIQLKFLQQVAVSLRGKALLDHDISIQGRFLVIANK